MNRRFFLQWASLGGLATLLPGCLKQLNASQVTANMAGVLPIPLAPKQAGTYIPVGTVSELDRAGYLLNENTPLGAVMVVKDSLGQLKAVNPACPHRGCLVNWQADQEQFFCPCHSAWFASEGTVLSGPTQSNLETFAARIEQDTVLVSRFSVTNTMDAAPDSRSSSPDRSTADQYRERSDNHQNWNDDDDRDDDDYHDDDHDRDDD
jgi:cytochrome b6-f complex iron-sulfur subunit